MRIRSLPLRPLLWIGLCAAAGCSGAAPPSTTPTPTPSVPAISCPADVPSASGVAPVTVTYAAPVVSGGASPVTTTCTINSGASFPSGTSDVVCTATDALQRQAQCVFHVTVATPAAPRLQGTNFLAFGDSLTWGEVSQPVTTLHVFDPLNNYPTLLQGLLKTRYESQASGIAVTNRGELGEGVAAGEERLLAELQRVRPDVLLFLEGTNDVNNGVSPLQIGQSIRANIRRATQLGTKLILVSTLPPEVPGRFRAYNPDGIGAANDSIRDAVAREGGVLVDLFAAFEPRKALLIGDDGLHPTAGGYQVLAETLLAAIKAQFELPPATTPQLFSAPGSSLAARDRRSGAGGLASPVAR